MKKRISIIFGLIALLMATLACGSSSEIQVNEPSTNSSVSKNTADPVEPTKAPIGSVRSNPAPVGSEILADDMNFSVKSIVRPANDIVIEGNMFNDEPEEGQEYLLVEISAECTKTTDEKCSISTFNFKTLGKSGVINDVEYVAGVKKLLEETEFFGGSTVSGYLAFMVDIGDTLLLVYDPLFSSNEFYLSLPTE